MTERIRILTLTDRQPCMFAQHCTHVLCDVPAKLRLALLYAAVGSRYTSQQRAAALYHLRADKDVLTPFVMLEAGASGSGGSAKAVAEAAAAADSEEDFDDDDDSDEDFDEDLDALEAELKKKSAID